MCLAVSHSHYPLIRATLSFLVDFLQCIPSFHWVSGRVLQSVANIWWVSAEFHNRRTWRHNNVSVVMTAHQQQHCRAERKIMHDVCARESIHGEYIHGEYILFLRTRLLALSFLISIIHLKFCSAIAGILHHPISLIGKWWMDGWLITFLTILSWYSVFLTCIVHLY